MRVGALLRVLLVVLACLVPARALAYTPPPLQGAVTDTSGTLPKADRDALEARLRAYREKTTNEVVVFLLASLGGETVEDVAYGAFDTWRVGKKGKDNGVLLVLAVNDRKMRIETGKGIGDKLTDVESGRILRERIGPFLKQQRWKDGIEAGLDAIEAALDERPAHHRDAFPRAPLALELPVRRRDVVRGEALGAGAATTLAAAATPAAAARATRGERAPDVKKPGAT